MENHHGIGGRPTWPSLLQLTVSLPYMRLALQRIVCQFWALCLGHSTAPQLFTRVFALVSEWAHWKGISFLHCLDYWLVFMESIPLLLQHLEQSIVQKCCNSFFFSFAMFAVLLTCLVFWGRFSSLIVGWELECYQISYSWFQC